jgi:ketosteroid isomerase-like protein
VAQNIHPQLRRHELNIELPVPLGGGPYCLGPQKCSCYFSRHGGHCEVGTAAIPLARSPFDPRCTVIRRALLVPLVLVLALATPMASGAQGPGSEEARLRAVDDQERQAVLRSDQPALERLWSDSLRVNAPSNRVSIGRRAVLDIIRAGGIHYSVFERTVETVRVDGDVGIVMGSETVVPAGSGSASPPSTPRRFTNIWKREQGEWRMIARHANNIVVPAH